MKAVSSRPIHIMIKYRILAELALYSSFFSVFYLCVSVLNFRPLMPLTRLSTGSVDVIDSVNSITVANCLI